MFKKLHHAFGTEIYDRYDGSKDIIATSIFLIEIKTNNGIKKATGFLVTKNRELFLVTNFHNLYGLTPFDYYESLKDINLPALSISMRNTIAGNLGEIYNINNENESNVFIHPLIEEKYADVVVIRLDIKIQEHIKNLLGLNENSEFGHHVIKNDHNNLYMGHPGYVFGYPLPDSKSTPFSSDDIVAIGSNLASNYSVFDTEAYFYIAGLPYSGCSGGPYLLREREVSKIDCSQVNEDVNTGPASVEYSIHSTLLGVYAGRLREEKVNISNGLTIDIDWRRKIFDDILNNIVNNQPHNELPNILSCYK